MKMIWMLAAAATLAACHRGEDEMGAAPDRGDTTAVTTGADTSTVTNPADTTMIPTTPSDTSMVPTTPTDTSMTPSNPSDSTGNPGAYDTPITPSDSGTGNTGVDTTGGYSNPPSAGDTSGTYAPSSGDTGTSSDSGMSPSSDTTSTR